MSIGRHGSTIKGLLVSAVLGLSVSTSAQAASPSDVMMMAECGGFFNAYGSLIGHQNLYKTGSLLAAQVMELEDDKHSVALSFERGGEFAGSLHEASATDEIAGYIRNCSSVVARNGDYLANNAS